MSLNIIICVEQGVLEAQAQLLVRSAQTWLAGVDHQITAYSPRPGHWPAPSTLNWFAAQGVAWCAEPLNEDFNDYPIANKVLACRHFEQTHPQPASLMFLDTDTVFLNPIEAHWLSQPQGLFLRPVDNKGPGSESADDPNDGFWQAVFALCLVDLPAPAVQTTVRPHLIRNYFNAGYIWAHHLPGFFAQWQADFMTLVESELRPFGYRSRDGDDFRCLDQVALAVTATRFQAALTVLPETHNYPLPFKPLMQQRPHHPSLSELVHVHYHRWFQHPDFLTHITTAPERNSPQYRWLASQLPISPEINDPFKC